MTNVTARTTAGSEIQLEAGAVVDLKVVRASERENGKRLSVLSSQRVDLKIDPSLGPCRRRQLIEVSVANLALTQPPRVAAVHFLETRTLAQGGAP